RPGIRCRRCDPLPRASDVRHRRDVARRWRPGGRSVAPAADMSTISDRHLGSLGGVLSVNVGMPKDVPWNGKIVFTGVFKDPVTGPCHAGKLNLAGDGQGDLAGHGGEQRAVFVYQIESYRYWQEQLKRGDFVHGQFGENFT